MRHYSKLLCQTALTAHTLILLALPAMAGSVYKWQDDAGMVHYSDQKPAGRPSQEMNIKPTFRPDGSSPPDANRLQEQVEKLNEQQELMRLKEQQAADSSAEAKQQQESCEKATNNLNVLTTQSRIRTEGPDGELKYLTPEEIIEQRKKAQELIDKNCKDQP
jgi:hypothetical protein